MRFFGLSLTLIVLSLTACRPSPAAEPAVFSGKGIPTATAPSATATPQLPPARATSVARKPTASPTPHSEAETDPERLVGPPWVPEPPRYRPIALKRDRALERSIQDSLGAEAEHYGVVVKRLSDGRGVAVNPQKVFYAASLFKLPVMYEVYWQHHLNLLDLNESLTMTEFYADYALGNLEVEVGESVTIAQAAEAIIARSENALAVLLQDRVGPWNVSRHLAALGLEGTNLSTELPTTAGDMALLLEMLAREKAVDPASSKAMLDLLLAQEINDRLPALLPKGVPVAHKTGDWENATHDVGIVYAPSGPYVVAVLSEKTWESKPIAQLSRLVFDSFEDRGGRR